jgi:hypothetical protein
MAKPKSPNSKKSNDLKPTVSATSTPPLASNGTTPAEAAAPATETIETSIETKTAATKNTTPINKMEPRKTARKPEIVKTEPRTNLVPISLEEEIRQLAYLLSERRGFKSGHETEDWLAAENEVRQRYRQHSA